MDILSIILLGLVAVWFIWALRHVISNKGGCSCGCGGSKRKKNSKCSGGCSHCSGCESCHK